jgi:hypothetical protein
MYMTYQIAQKTVLYILGSKSCIVNQLWTLLNLEEQLHPLYCKLGFVGMHTLEHPNPS